jgi:hypothetical protein
MTWTSAKPTKEGWYWYRVGDLPGRCVQVVYSRDFFYVNYGDDYVDIAEAYGQWSSEFIPLPDEGV